MLVLAYRLMNNCPERYLKQVMDIFSQTALTFNFGKSKFDRGVEENLVNTQTDIFEVQLGINPGLAVFIMQNVSIECSLGIAGIRYRQEKQKNNLGETGKRNPKSSDCRQAPSLL